MSGLVTCAFMAAYGCGGADSPEAQNPTSPLVHEADGAVVRSDGGKTDARVTSNHGDGGIDHSPYGNGTCDSITIQAAPNAPDVLIVLDRSGSMIGHSLTNPGPDRWGPSSTVIKTLTAQLDQTMNFGLMLFPDAANSDGLGMCSVGKLDVPIAPGAAANIATAIDKSPPTQLSATPTAATLHGALAAINALPPPCADACASPEKYVLLVTDGAPNCGTPGNLTTTQSDIDACNTGIDKLKAAGVTTYVIGYNTTDTKTAAIMNGFATHGGTDHQLPVEDQASLLSTLTKIAGQLVSCDYKLATPVLDPSFVLVTIDGQQINLGDGWTLGADQKTITLTGACDTLRDAKPHNLHISLECTQVIGI